MPKSPTRKAFFVFASMRAIDRGGGGKFQGMFGEVDAPEYKAVERHYKTL